jgi:hypothetical protein
VKSIKSYKKEAAESKMKEKMEGSMKYGQSTYNPDISPNKLYPYLN